VPSGADPRIGITNNHRVGTEPGCSSDLAAAPSGRGPLHANVCAIATTNVDACGCADNRDRVKERRSVSQSYAVTPPSTRHVHADDSKPTWSPRGAKRPTRQPNSGVKGCGASSSHKEFRQQTWRKNSTVTIRQMGALVTDDFHKVSGIVGSTVPSNNTRFVNFGRVNPAPWPNGRKTCLRLALEQTFKRW